MAFPETPFDRLSVGSDTGEEPFDGEFDDEIDPAVRTPAFRAPSSDLEDTPLDLEDSEIISLLSSYFDEAENVRETGFNPRHEVWEENLHAFWMRKSFEDKLEWQSAEISASVANFVERFAALHRQALTQTPDWVSVKDLQDETGQYSAFATKLTRLALDFAGTNASGHPVPFEHIFGNLCQTGALMKMVAAVNYDPRNGRVAVEQVDPRQCYWDPTGRGLYRVRFWEADKETLLRQAELLDSEGNPIYDKEAIEGLVAHHDRDIVANREDSSGQGQSMTSVRTPILIKEWLVDLIDRKDNDTTKRKVRERQLVVIANDSVIIRGPESNPWWHGKDWIVGHPVLQAPLSPVDGRTYVELFRSAVATNENVMNRIIDIASMNMNAFEVNPDVLDNPEQIEFGIAPNQTIIRSEDANPGERGISVIEMGRTIGADLMNLWEATKQEAQEAAAQSDISLGQSVQSGETTATEVQASQQGASALNNSISMDIDLGFLGPIAELVYFTALQKVGPESPGIWNGLTKDEQAMLLSRRDEFKQRPLAIRASGLTKAVEKGQRTRGLLGALNVIGGNPQLLQSFISEYSMSKLLTVILKDFGVDAEELRLSQQEKIRNIDKASKAEAKAKADEFIAGANGQVPPGEPESIPPITSQNQGGVDPAAPGVPEGLSGAVL